MNILYLSHLSGASYAGPTYSVPRQIEAQSKIDNVFWYNAVNSGKAEWRALPYYHDLTEYPEESIYKLPKPFNHPDLIVVESFYNMTLSRLRKELVTETIPYIIVPRGELTKQAQARKSLKKRIANMLLCKKFAKKAAAIQYLTEQEYMDSGDDWNENSIVIPNGINIPERVKENFSQDGIKCVSIGRIEPYQKGLDMLIEAYYQIKEELTEAKCEMSIYGPDREGKLSVLKSQVEEKNLGSIISFSDGIYGKEKEEILLSSDVFIMPSRFEGHPMALIEAMAYGLPCVVSRGSNMLEEIREYEAGWVCESSITDLKNALLKMLDEKETFAAKSQQARQLAKTYDWNSIAARTHDLLTDFTSGKN